MHWRATAFLVALGIGIASPGRGQEPPERVRVFCDRTDPRNRCPGADCACIDDTLEVTFDGDSDSVHEYAAFQEGAVLQTVVVTDTKTPGVQGFSFAVEHEDRFLTIAGVTFDGTESARAERGGFAFAGWRDLEVCPHRDRTCRGAVPGAGYICGVILGTIAPATLPLGRNKLCAATYAMKADPGPNGTLLKVVDRRLRGQAPSPPVAINLTAVGKSRMPATLVDGWVKAAGAAVLEDCDNSIDDDGDGQTDCDDPECGETAACGGEDCSNYVDDDGDGLKDCDDRECWQEPECQPRPEICGNQRDDDRDGATDCMDPECCGYDSCWDSPICPGRAEVCGNFRDDDRDGLTDCEDPDCCGEPLCEFAPVCPPRPEVCGNFLDDDRDGLFDCDDPDCAADESCLPGPARKRLFCDPAGPANQCPGEACKCAPATLEVTFDGKADSVFQVDAFQAGARIETTIVSDVGTKQIWGWSYGVEHDPAFLALESVTVAGTDAEQGLNGGFVVASRDPIEACLPGDPGCKETVPGFGYISAVILSFGAPWDLPLRRDTLCRAIYTLEADPGTSGTLLRFADKRLKAPGSPPIDINFTVAGRSKPPRWLVDGLVKSRGDAGQPAAQGAAFLRGDADGNGRVNVADVIALLRVLFAHARPKFDCEPSLDTDGDGRMAVGDVVHLIRYVFSRGPDLPAPFPQCGIQGYGEQGPLLCAESNCK